MKTSFKSYITVSFLLIGFLGWGQVTLPHHDPINYTVGQGLQTQTGWTSLNSGDALLISSGNLTYAGLSTATGNKVTFDGAGIDAAKLFTQQNSGTVYYSFLLNITSLGSLNTTGGYFTSFNEGTGSNFGGTVWLRSDGAGFDVGINPRTTAANTVWSTGTQSINTTLFVVVSYQIVAGSSNDIVNLWINPTPGSSMPAVTLTATNSGTDLANLNRILLRQDGTTSTPFVEMDELRVGTTWADVTPADATINLLASPSSLTGFNYIETAGPSASQNFILSGTSLNGTDVTLTAPTNYQISEDNSSFSSSITLTAYNGSNKTIYVRLKSGLTAGSYTSENITISGGGDTDGASVSCSGTVSPLTISFNVSTASVTENGISYSIQVNTNALGSHSADIVVTGGTATNGNQYTFSTATATFTDSMSYTATVTINDNNICASATNTIFGLSSLSSGLTFGTVTSLTLTINDDDLVSGNQYIQDFDGTTTVWSYTGSGTVSNVYGKTNNGIRIGGSQSFILDNVSTVGMYNLKFLLNNSSVGGIENSDALKIYVALNGASFSVTPDIQIQEGNPSDSNYNKTWLYTANNTAITTAGIPLTFNGDGVNGYAKVEINIPSGTSSISVKIESTNSATDEYFYIDDIRLNGEICNICTEPTVDAAFWANSPQTITGTSVDLHWTNGNGTNRLVSIREALPITFVPNDGISYSANANFSSGTAQSDDSKVVYNGSSNSVTVSGLTPGTIYYSKIFEYGCTTGNENYLTSGNPTTDIFVTTPENPNTFERGCMDNTTITLNWTPPVSGTFEGYLLTARQGATPSAVNSIDPSSIVNANSNISLAETYGTSSYHLYKGVGNTVTITGLNPGQSYTFKLYTYTDAGTVYEYASGITTTPIIELSNTTAAYAMAGDTQATILWDNPTLGCFDDILVVANETPGIDFIPTGNGSSYIANTVYSGINSVVYNNTASNVTVTGLLNGTTYYFEIFVRKGTEWSSGVEVSIVPNAGTIFKPGELVFVGYDAQYSGSGADDEYLVATLVDLKPATSFSLVNSRYEAGAAANVRTDKWGGAGDDASMNPGVALISYTGSVNIPAGSVLIFHTDGTTNVFDYIGVITGTTITDETSNFTTSLPFGTASAPNISLSASDQIFLVQGVFTFDGTADPQQANYSLNGVLLHGITNRAAWVPLSAACNGDDSGGNTRESRLYPGLNCFNVENQSISARSGYYQNSQIHTGSLRNIILGISNASYWTLGTGGYTTDPSSTAINRAGHTFTITGGNPPGTWVSSSDTNWFNCANWENLAVPDENADVLISNTFASVNPVIDYVASYSDLFSDVAQTKNLSIQGLKLVLEGNISNKLEVYGDLTIQTSGSLDMDDNTSTDDGQLYVFGNWDNQVGASAFEEGNGTIHFMGTSMQSVSCNSDTEKFYNIVLNNPTGFTTDSFNNDLHAEGSLTLNQGNLIVKSGHYALAGVNLSIGTGTTLEIENNASLVQTDNAGIVTNNGTINVRRTTSPYNQYDYTYFSSPIVGETVTDALGAFSPLYTFDAGNYADLYSGSGFPQTGTVNPDGYDDATPFDWQTASGTMTPGVGYIARGNAASSGQAVLFHANAADGRLNNGTVTVTLEKDAYDVTGTEVADYGATIGAKVLNSNNNANLIGNPYPSALDLVELYNDNSSLLTGSFYFWTHNSLVGTGTGPWGLNYNTNDFASYNATGTPVGTAASTNGNNNDIPTGFVGTGQGFLASIQEGASSFTLTFDNSQRGVPTTTEFNNNQFYRQGQNQALDRIWLNFTAPDGEPFQTFVGFEEGASNDYDVFDTQRMENGSANDFYSFPSHDFPLRLAIQRVEPFTTDKIIPLGMEITSSGTASIAINHVEGVFNEGQIVYLEDLDEGIVHNLSEGAYLFNQEAGDNINNRFVLRFADTALANEEEAMSALKVYPNPSKDVFTLAYSGTKEIHYTVFDLTGKKLIEATSQTIDLKGYPTGLYWVEISDGTSLKTLKLIKY